MAKQARKAAPQKRLPPLMSQMQKRERREEIARFVRDQPLEDRDIGKAADHFGVSYSLAYAACRQKNVKVPRRKQAKSEPAPARSPRNTKRRSKAKSR